jgi:hypothetical protein
MATRLSAILCDHSTLQYGLEHMFIFQILADLIPGFNNFLPIIIENGLGFSSIQAQYLTIPGTFIVRQAGLRDH